MKSMARAAWVAAVSIAWTGGWVFGQEDPLPVRFDFGAEASVTIAKILATSQRLKPWVVQKGYRQGKKVEGALCEARVYRPSFTAPPLTHPDNRVHCEIGYPGGAKAQVALPLKEPIEAWGNKWDRAHSVSFSGRQGELLAAAIEEEHLRDPGNPFLAQSESWGPPGKVVFGMESLDIRRFGRWDSLGAILCTRYKEMELPSRKVKLLRTECALVDPARAPASGH